MAWDGDEQSREALLLCLFVIKLFFSQNHQVHSRLETLQQRDGCLVLHVYKTMSVSLQGKHAARSTACVCVQVCIERGMCAAIFPYICLYVCVEGWRATAIIISVTHHCWGKEREEEELHSHAVEGERVKTKKDF